MTDPATTLRDAAHDLRAMSPTNTLSDLVACWLEARADDIEMGIAA